MPRQTLDDIIADIAGWVDSTRYTPGSEAHNDFCYQLKREILRAVEIEPKPTYWQYEVETLPTDEALLMDRLNAQARAGWELVSHEYHEETKSTKEHRVLVFRHLIDQSIETDRPHQWFCGGKAPCACMESWKAGGWKESRNAFHDELDRVMEKARESLNPYHADVEAAHQFAIDVAALSRTSGLDLPTAYFAICELFEAVTQKMRDTGRL